MRTRITAALVVAAFLAGCSGAPETAQEQATTAAPTPSSQAAAPTTQDAPETVTATVTETVEAPAPETSNNPLGNTQDENNAVWREQLQKTWDETPFDENVAACAEWVTADDSERREVFDDQYEPDLVVDKEQWIDFMVELWEEHCSSEEIAGALEDTAPTAGGDKKFGDVFVYEDGLEISVSEPVPFTPSDTAAGGEDFDHHVRFTISITNNTGDRFEIFWVSVDGMSGTSAVDQVYDWGNGIEGSPSSTILDGRTIEWDVAVGVEDPDDIIISVSPNFDYDDALFSN